MRMHANDRQNTADHARIHEDVDEKGQCDGAAGEAGKGVLPLHREIQRPADDDCIEREHQQLAEESEFLADHGEDEVGRTLRQELELRLAAVHVALAEDTARADRDLGLDDVISGAERVVLWIQESENSLSLVFVDEMPANPRGADEQRNGDENDLHCEA